MFKKFIHTSKKLLDLNVRFFATNTFQMYPKIKIPQIVKFFFAHFLFFCFMLTEIKSFFIDKYSFYMILSQAKGDINMLGRYKYTLSTLTPGEEIMLVGRLHYFALIIPFTLTGATLTAFIFAVAMTFQAKSGQPVALMEALVLWLGVLFLAICTSVSWLKRNLIEMVCTNKRVVRRTGIINVTTEELNRERIESVEMRQSILGRIFNYGDIFFSGTGTSKLVFHFINQPRLMKQIIDAVINEPKELPETH